MPAVGEALPKELRQEFERDVLAAYARIGRENFRALPVVRVFRAKHAIGASTLYRWIDAMRAAGVLDQEIGGLNGNFADRLPASNLYGQEGIAKDADGEQIPADQPLARLAPDHNPPATSGLAVVRNLEQCISASLEIMQRARRAPRDLDQARIVIGAAEALRRCLETAIRLRETIWTLTTVEEFHRCIVQAVREKCPAAADQIFERLEKISHAWVHAGGNPAS